MMVISQVPTIVLAKYYCKNKLPFVALTGVVEITKLKLVVLLPSNERYSGMRLFFIWN